MTLKIFTRHSKVQTDVPNFFPGEFYQNSAQFSEIQKCKKDDDLSFNRLNHSLSEYGPSPS